MRFRSFRTSTNIITGNSIEQSPLDGCQTSLPSLESPIPHVLHCVWRWKYNSRSLRFIVEEPRSMKAHSLCCADFVPTFSSELWLSTCSFAIYEAVDYLRRWMAKPKWSPKSNLRWRRRQCDVGSQDLFRPPLWQWISWESCNRSPVLSEHPRISRTAVSRDFSTTGILRSTQSKQRPTHWFHLSYEPPYLEKFDSVSERESVLNTI